MQTGIGSHEQPNLDARSNLPGQAQSRTQLLRSNVLGSPNQMRMTNSASAPQISPSKAAPLKQLGTGTPESLSMMDEALSKDKETGPQIL